MLEDVLMHVRYHDLDELLRCHVLVVAGRNGGLGGWGAGLLQIGECDLECRPDL